MTTFAREFNFNNDIMAVVAQNIRKYRILRGITQEQLAVDIGISHEYMRRVESQNGSKGLTFENIYKISVVLGVTLDDLIQEEKEVVNN